MVDLTAHTGTLVNSPILFFNFIYSIWLKLLEGFLVEVARRKSVILTVALLVYINSLINKL